MTQTETRPPLDSPTTDQGSMSFYKDRSDSFRENSDRILGASSNLTPELLLVDDDPCFGLLMKKVAEIYGIHLTHLLSVEELSFDNVFLFDTAIIDYDLGPFNGCDLTAKIEFHVKKEVPVILVSQTHQKITEAWPATIREFVHKKLGPVAILESAYEAHEIQQIQTAIPDLSQN